MRISSAIIADDHHLVRESFRVSISLEHPGIQIREAWDLRTLLHAAGQSPASDVALVDLNMPGMRSGASLHELYFASPSLPVVVVSAMTSPDLVRQAMQVPCVYAFVPKSANHHHMRQAIACALERRKLDFHWTHLPEEVATVNGLTPRMEEIRSLVRLGMSNKAIAGRLGITEGTVKNYMSEIFRVLQVRNRTQVAQFEA